MSRVVLASQRLQIVKLCVKFMTSFISQHWQSQIKQGICTLVSASKCMPKKRQVKHIKHNSKRRLNTPQSSYYLSLWSRIWIINCGLNFGFVSEQPKITLMCLTLSSFSVFGFFPVTIKKVVFGLIHEAHRNTLY